MNIKILSETTINRIAAGEVVERPASVIKELIENAIDADAKNILIKLDASGKNLITVTDDGHGMNKDEIQIALERHSTSKLNEDDILLNINYLGFRGEALPSIASISKFSITSRTQYDDLASTVQITAGQRDNIKNAIHDIGTTVEVRDIFFATPARLKFLRSNETELNACKACIRKMALAHHKISFTLYHNNKILMDIGATSSLSERIEDIIGSDFTNNASTIDLKNSYIS